MLVLLALAGVSASVFGVLSGFSLIGLSVIQYLQPMWGLALLFPLVSPENLDPGQLFIRGTEIRYAELAFWACVAVILIPRHRSTINFKPLFWGGPFVLAMLVSGFANLAWYQAVPYTLRQATFIVAIFLSANACKYYSNISHKRVFKMSLCFASFVYVSYGFYQFVVRPASGEDKLFKAMATSLFEGPNTLAAYIVAVAPFILAFSLSAKKPQRVVYGALFTLSFVVLILTFRRAAILAFVPSCLIVTYLKTDSDRRARKRCRRRSIINTSVMAILLGAVLVGLTAVVSQLGPQEARNAERYLPGRALNHYTARLSRIQLGWNIWLDHWLLGIGGPTRYPEVARDYIPELFPSLGGSGPETWPRGLRKQTHMLYFQMAVEYGIVGFVAFLYLLYALGAELRDKWRKQWTRAPDLGSDPWLLGGIGMFVGVLIYNLFTVTLRGVPMEAGILFGIAAAVPAERLADTDLA